MHPCVAYNLRSFDNVSVEVGLDMFHPCHDSDNTLGQRYDFTEHCITLSPSGFMSAKRLGHKHVDAFMIDVQGNETVFLRHLQSTGFLQEIDQLQNGGLPGHVDSQRIRGEVCPVWGPLRLLHSGHSAAGYSLP